MTIEKTKPEEPVVYKGRIEADILLNPKVGPTEYIARDHRYPPGADPVLAGAPRPVVTSATMRNDWVTIALAVAFVIALITTGALAWNNRDRIGFMSERPVVWQTEQVAPPPAYVPPPVVQAPAPKVVVSQLSSVAGANPPRSVVDKCKARNANAPTRNSDGSWSCSTSPYATHLSGEINERLAAAKTLTEFRLVCDSINGRMFINQRGKPQCDFD